MLHSLLVQETIENLLSLACSLLLNLPKNKPFLAIPIVEVLVGHWLPLLDWMVWVLPYYVGRDILILWG